MEKKELDKRHQRTGDKPNQKTTNGFKNSPKDQPKPTADTHGSTAGSDWNSKNQPTETGRSIHNKPGAESYQNQYSEQGSAETKSDHQLRNSQTQKKQTGKDKGKWDGQDMNQPTKERTYNPSPESQYDQNVIRTRDTASAGVIDEDRGPFQDEEIDHLSRKSSFGESVDTENSSIDSPKKKNQAPQSKFS